MNTMASQITSLAIVYSTVYSGADQWKCLCICAGNSPTTGEFPAQMAVTRKMFPFDDVIMIFTSSELNLAQSKQLKHIAT